MWGRGKRRLSRESADVLARIHGKAVRYVARRVEDGMGRAVESVLGKEGRININEDDLVVMCNGHEVFRCPVGDVVCSELLSLDGVVIKGSNTYTGGEDVVVAYYKYYR